MNYQRSAAVSGPDKAACARLASSSMSQVKIYGLRSALSPVIRDMSEVIHSCVVDALQYPPDKRAHRFFPLETEEFFYPPGRTERYTIVEFSMFEGRSVEAKKTLIRLLFKRFAATLNIGPQDLEITIFETPRHNWGFRGLPGDEHALNYKVDV
jgi:phenylpyruvate tautomerase PptA (4-oxalocrotonate tautomerase family)